MMVVGELGLSISSYMAESFYWQRWQSCGYGDERKESDCPTEKKLIPVQNVKEH